MTKLTEIKVPDIGERGTVEVIEVLVKPGDTVNSDDPIITLETDKATMEVPTNLAGIIKDIKVKLGSTVAKGDVIATLELSEPSVQQHEIPDSQLSFTKAGHSDVTDDLISNPVFAALEPPQTSLDITFRKAYASPSVRKLARELGADLGLITGTGEKNRITHQDVYHFVKSTLSATNQPAFENKDLETNLQLLAWPEIDFTKFGPTEIEPLSRIQKISGANLLRNWVMIPHVTLHENADITDLESFRQQIKEEALQQQIKISLLAFIIKAAVLTLKKFPRFNASLKGENLILKKYYHVGFAVDTPHGLMVPVLQNVEQKGIYQIATELGHLSALARSGKLKPTDMQGATFTVSSLGGIGSTAFTPIINAPEVAILGVSKAQTAAVWNGSAFLPRLICPLSLSVDHRVIDGALAARFIGYLAELLADVRRLTL